MFAQEVPIFKSRAALVFRRGISIEPASITPILKDVVADESKVSTNVPSLHYPKGETNTIKFTKDEPTFRVLGTPQSTLSLTVPPSIPVHIKRGSLMSLYSPGSETAIDSSVTSTMEISQPIRKFIYGGITSAYQHIRSTVPLNMLISAYSTGGFWSAITSHTKKEATKTFCNIAMDGTVDWALFQPKSLQVYTGNSLSITGKKFPIRSKKSKRITLGTFFHRGYSLMSGRGFVSLVGSGSIFKLSLGHDEEVYIRKSNILASTVKDISEFATGDFQKAKINNKTRNQMELEQKRAEEQNLKIKTLITTTETHTPTTWDKLRVRFIKALNWIWYKVNDASNKVIGNGEYIKITGPRLLLLQTSTGYDQFIFGSDIRGSYFKSRNIKETEKFIKKEKELIKPVATVGDNLSVVTIAKDGGIKYHNTENFNDEVKRIESKTDVK